MKKSILLCLILILTLICFESCKKEDDNIPADHRRIVQIILSNDSRVDSTKVLFSYENNLLVNRTVVHKSNINYNTWDTTIKCNYTYSGDIVTAVLYLGDGGELHLGEKIEYEFTDKRMDRMKYFVYVDSQFMSRDEYFFNFNGELLESFNYYYDFEDNGILHECSLGEYTYEDQNINRFRIKDLFYDEYFYNEDFVYDNGVLDNWISSENYRLTNNWNKLYKERYEYNSDNNIEKTRVYDWHFSWSFSYSITLQYDQSNLIMEDYSAGVRIDYIYEDGIGNSEQLVFTPMDQIYNSPVIEKIYDGSLKARVKLMNMYNSN